MCTMLEGSQHSCVARFHVVTCIHECIHVTTLLLRHCIHECKPKKAKKQGGWASRHTSKGIGLCTPRTTLSYK